MIDINYDDYSIDELVSLIMHRDGLTEQEAYEKAYQLIEDMFYDDVLV